MSEPNYESKWWGYIYDQMMTQDLHDMLDSHLQFYQTNLRAVHGPILECACGTGLFLLPLLASGHDMYGFDISSTMVAQLKTKAEAQGIADINRRISLQDFVSFHYEHPFDAIIIPTNTFLMLTTQEAQITTLKHVYTHLAPGGTLLLDLQLAGMRSLVEHPEVVHGRWHTWSHPETRRPIRQRMDGRIDFNHQQTLDHCYIEYENEREDFPMHGRWMFKDEFQLLLRLAGFTRWVCYGSPAGDHFHAGPDAQPSYWIIDKH
jgi:SAM-dependent methyltransferase